MSSTNEIVVYQAPQAEPRKVWKINSIDELTRADILFGYSFNAQKVKREQEVRTHIFNRIFGF